MASPKSAIAFAALGVVGGACATGRQPTLSLLAGHPGEPGRLDGVGAAARFGHPSGLAADGAGNVYVADNADYTIRKIVLATGAVTTLAGSPGEPGITDAAGTAARFRGPRGLAYDGAGSLYVVDFTAIRKIALSTGQVTTIAGSTVPGNQIGTGVRFFMPYSLAYDGTGRLYVGDLGLHAVLKVTLATGEVAPLVESPKTAAACDPLGLTFDGAGNLYEVCGRMLRKVAPASGVATPLAGSGGDSGVIDGVGATAAFSSPDDLAYDGAGNLYVSDEHAIRKVAVATGLVTTVARQSRPGAASPGPRPVEIERPAGLVYLSGQGLFIGEPEQHVILRLRVSQ